MTSDILVLAFHPLSSAYRKLLECKLGPGVVYKTIADLRRGGLKRLAGHLVCSHFRRVIIPCEIPEGRSVLSILRLLAMAHKFPRVEISDPAGNLRKVGWSETVVGALGLALASLDGYWACRRSGKRARRALRMSRSRYAIKAGAQRVLNLNNNLWFGLRAGGSVGHVAGVINGLVELGHRVAFNSPMTSEYLVTAVEIHRVPIPRDYAIPGETNLFRLQSRAVATALRSACDFLPTLVYQRLSLGDWTGVEVADALMVPLVVEYNGSEVWIARNWGGKSRFAAEMIAAEESMLRRADLVFTVSAALYEELLQRGLEPARVGWYPNCVDPAVFDPETIKTGERDATRRQLNAKPDDYIFMFVGTFGVWHGAEIFARAAALLSADEAWIQRHRVRFAFVGDGSTRAKCAELIADSPAAAWTVFTGLIPQHEAPRFLAAADAFVASHVPNADGSKFFGSPTKLFEYMAMERPIVASSLDQIGQVLSHEHTAVLVEPGDAVALTAGLRRVVEDRALGRRLAVAARAEVLEKYTWRRHVQEILGALERSAT